MVPRARELALLRDYISLQELRFGERISFEMDCDSRCDALRVPKFILQPLVENAIYHGMEFMDGDGEILVRAYLENGDLWFSVSDNGLGMTKEQAASLLTDSSHIPSKKGSGIGVKNVNERIRLYFGEAYGLLIQSEPDEGTTVVIHLPAIPYEEAQEKA